MSKKIKTQKGFTVIEGLLFVLILSVIGFGGYYVWNSQKQANKSFDSAQKVSQSIPEIKSTAAPAMTPPKTTTKTTPESTHGYLVIKEWGIKVQLGEADPSIITYRLNSNGYTGQANAAAELKLTSSVTTNENCRKLGISILKNKSDAFGGHKVGNYWYGVGGSPYTCGNATIDSIRQRYVGNYPSTWKFLSI